MHGLKDNLKRKVMRGLQLSKSGLIRQFMGHHLQKTKDISDTPT